MDSGARRLGDHLPGREEFLRDGAGPILARLDGPIQADVRDLVTEGDKLVAFWRGPPPRVTGSPTSTTTCGR